MSNEKHIQNINTLSRIESKRDLKEIENRWIDKSYIHWLEWPIGCLWSFRFISDCTYWLLIGISYSTG
jgi:hypothetical protein